MSRRPGRLGAVAPTARGSALALVGLGALLVGYLFGWRELVIVGWSSAALLLLSALLLLRPPRLEARFALESERVAIGEPLAVRIGVTARASSGFLTGSLGMPSPESARVAGSAAGSAAAGAVEARFEIGGLVAGEHRESRHPVPTDRRGRFRVGPLRLETGDPLALLRRETTHGETTSFVVHPRVVALQPLGAGRLSDLDGSATRDATASDMSLHSLREYTRGDDPRRVHWRSSAKTGTLLVRRFERTRRSRLAVALDTRTTAHSAEAGFELAVTVVASLGVRAVREGRGVSVTTGVVAGGSGDPTHGPGGRRMRASDRGRPAVPTSIACRTETQLLDGLSVVRPSEHSLGVVDLVARTSGDPGTSLLFVVCGAGTGIDELAGAANVLPADSLLLAVRCSPGSRPERRTSRGLTILTIGFADDLRKFVALERAR